MNIFKYTFFLIIGILVMSAWNIFLIGRDDKMFKSYYGETSNEQYCSGQYTNCNLK